MTAPEIIQEIEAAGGVLAVKSGKITFDVPTGLRPLVDSLRERKDEVIALLQARDRDPDEGDKSAPVQSPAVATEANKSEDFTRWVLERCALRENHEDSQSVGSLQLDYIQWCYGHNTIPCSRETFEALLQDAGFVIRDSFAIGVILKADWPNTQTETLVRYYAVPQRKPDDGEQCSPLFRGLRIAGRRQV